MSMDALEFLKNFNRMRESYQNCDSCPLEEKKNCDCLSGCTDNEMKINISTVEQWPKEHPRKTRQSVFLEQYPEAELDKNGVLRVCPAPISPKYRSDGRCATFARGCVECRKEYWMQEVE